jgi:DmsE family decaheme c-type cytochrome
MRALQRVLLALAVVGVALGIVQMTTLAAEPEPAASSSNDCATCHAENLQGFEATRHAGLAGGCASCHSTAAAHLKSVTETGEPGPAPRFSQLSAGEANKICLGCHENKGTQKHWAGSAHDSRGVSCINCHNVHPPAGHVLPAQLRKAQIDLCTTCHLQKKAALLRSGHMPMREAKMECTTCHNPHGTPNDRALLQTSVNQNCYSCHAEKRGPFLWEHPPVRENCLNCHDAHGTIQDKLLKVKQPLLCQQCHQTASHPGPAYGSMSRYAFNQGCLHCHPAVHGSTHPSGNRLFR